MPTCPHCGCEIGKARALRSHPQLARFMLLMQAAFEHWPEGHPFQPRSWEHLRFWFAVQAGHFTMCKTIICKRAPAGVVRALLTAIVNSIDDERVFVDEQGSTVTIRKAGSISFKALPHMKACGLFATVDDMLASMGLPPNELLPMETNGCVTSASAIDAGAYPA